MAHDDLGAEAVNDRLAALKKIFEIDRRLECIDWRLPAEALPSVTEEETAIDPAALEYQRADRA